MNNINFKYIYSASKEIIETYNYKSLKIKRVGKLKAIYTIAVFKPLKGIVYFKGCERIKYDQMTAIKKLI